MAQDSNISLRPLTLRTMATTGTTNTTTSTSTTTSITSQGHWGHHGMDDISESELEPACSFAGFELESRSARLFSNLRQILMNNSNSLGKETRKRSLSGLNGVIRKRECGNHPLSVSENVESDNLHGLQKVLIEENKLEYGMKKKDNLVNIEKISLHDKTHPEVEDVCFIGIGGDGLEDVDESSTDIIIIKEIVHDNSPLAVSGVQQGSDPVQPSKERKKAPEHVPPYHCLAYKEPSPESYFLENQVEMEQESQYHLYGAPEIIEEVVTVDDMEVIPEVLPNTDTFSSPLSSVALMDHSYSSLPLTCLQETLETLIPSQEEENSEIESEGDTEEIVCATDGASPQGGNDREDCEAKSSTSGTINVLTCQNDGDVSDDGFSIAATSSSVPHCSEVTTAVHLPNSGGRDQLNNVAATSNTIVHHPVILGELPHQSVDASDGLSDGATNNSVHHHPHITKGNIPCEQNKLRQETCVTDGAVKFEHLRDVKIILSNILTSLPEGKSAKKTIEDSPKKILEESPEKTIEDSPKKTVEDSPKKTVEDSPKKTVEDSPKKTVEDSPKKTVENSPKKFVEDSPKKTVEDPKLDSSRNSFYDGNSHKTAEMNVQNDESKECLQTPGSDNDTNQRAGSQERMLIRSSIQLRKRKVYKLIQVPQRKSINYDKISDIDTYYTKDVTCVENDSPVTRQKEIEKPPDLFPSSKAEKKAVSKIWQVLVSQLEDCVRGITTLPPPVVVHTKKRKRSLSRGKKRGNGCMTLQCHKESNGHNISVTHCAESQDFKTSQRMEVEGESDQTAQTSSGDKVPVIKRKSVCFCRYNTVLPLASRRTCCGRKRVKSGCRRSSRTTSRDFVFPTNKRSFFSSLGLMEKSLYDKDVYYESLVTHRTRNMRANQIKGKDHYRMFLDNLHGYCLDQNSEKLKQPLPLTFISKEKLCKLSTKSKAISKVSNVEWLVDESGGGDHNFEGFGDTESKESCSTSGLSPGQDCNFEASVSLGDVGSSVNSSETLPSIPFCCTDTNDNFTENYSLPKSQDSHLELSKSTGDVEECPVCEKSSDGICSLDHKLKMEALNKRIPESHSCETLQEKDHSNSVTENKDLQPSQIEDKDSNCAEKVDDEGCFVGTLLDSWSMSEEEFSTIDSDCTMEEINDDASSQLSTDEHSMSDEPSTYEDSMFKSDIMEVDDDSDNSSECSLPNLWTIGTENARSVCSTLTAAASSHRDAMSVVSRIAQEQFSGSTTQCDSVNEECDFLGFDNEPNCLKSGLQTPPCRGGKENTATVPQDFHGSDRLDGKSKLKYLEYQRHLMTLITKQHGSMDASKELEDLSYYVKEGSDVTNSDDLKYSKGKLSRTGTMKYKHELKGEDEAAESLVSKDTFLDENHTSKCLESEVGTLLSLSTKGTESLKASSLPPTLGSPKKNEKMAVKLPEFDLTRNCRVNLTKIQIPESAFEGIKIDAQDSIVSPMFSSDLSPERLIKRVKKSEPESCITLSRFSERLNVRRIKYSELLKQNMRRSLNGMCEKGRPLPASAAKHTRSVSDGIVFKCSTCLLTFRSKSSLNSHLETHKRIEFSCAECGLSFQQELQLQSHIRLHSTARQAVLCEKCGESFSQLEDLRNHVKNHLSPRPFKCKMCNQSCKCQATLNEPLQFHLKDCKNECVECGESLVASTNVRRHTRTHSRGKVHQCALCSVDSSPYSN